MSAPHDGGPAFPIPGLAHSEDFNGMTLRDYLAARAMQALITAQRHDNNVMYGVESATQTLARTAYMHADAMLKARNP